MQVTIDKSALLMCPECRKWLLRKCPECRKWLFFCLGGGGGGGGGETESKHFECVQTAGNGFLEYKTFIHIYWADQSNKS